MNRIRARLAAGDACIPGIRPCRGVRDFEVRYPKGPAAEILAVRHRLKDFAVPLSMGSAKCGTGSPGDFNHLASMHGYADCHCLSKHLSYRYLANGFEALTVKQNTTATAG